MDARKQRFGEDDLKKLFKGAKQIVTARGKKSVVFDVKKEGFPALADLAKVALGPSGNLRAPTLKLGDNWVVGFGQEAWEDYFG